MRDTNSWNKGIVTIIDADTICFLVGYNLRESEDIDECISLTDTFVSTILNNTHCNHYLGFLGSGLTFRHEIYPLYKSKRKPKPDYMVKWEPYIRHRLVSFWKFIVVTNIEAEDAVIICATHYKDSRNVCIAYVDKDMDFYCGNRYNYQKHQFSYSDLIGELVYSKGKLRGKGLRFQYAQLIMGDISTDCIPGLPSKGAKYAYDLLHDASTEYSMLRRVYTSYLRYCKEKNVKEYFLLQWSLIVMLKEESHGFTVPEPIEYKKSSVSVDDILGMI